MNQQEQFWAGEFGTDYTYRNDENLLKNKEAFFSRILGNLKIGSLLEIGCNRGVNLEAIKKIFPRISLNGIEINETAFKLISDKQICDRLYHASILKFESSELYDLVFTAGVLIHIHPNELRGVLQKMYQYSKRYILIAEYYSRNPQTCLYRSHSEKLFIDDFCGKIMALYPDLKLIDYGFVYHQDPEFPLDDITWFLLEKEDTK